MMTAGTLKKTLGAVMALGLIAGGAIGTSSVAAKTPPKKKAVAKKVTIYPAGTYQRSRPNGGTLTIKRQGNQWHLFVIAGGIPNGAGTAADCEVAAVGSLTRSHIVARPVPWRSERTTITPNDLYDVNGRVSVSFVKGGVQLTTTGITGPLCPMGSSFDGFYRKSR